MGAACEALALDSGYGPGYSGPDVRRRAHVRLARSQNNIKPKTVVSEPLLPKIASGDAAAVSSAIDRYGDLIWSIARRFISNQHEAEDAVQEIFIEIWSNAGRFDASKASEVTFVSMIARRRLIDRLRKHKRRPATESYEDHEIHMASDSSAPLEAHAEVEQVTRLLNDMRPEQREVMELSIYMGYSHGDIAERLRMPLGTVKTYLRRGLIALRKSLDLGSESGEVAT